VQNGYGRTFDLQPDKEDLMFRKVYWLVFILVFAMVLSACDGGASQASPSEAEAMMGKTPEAMPMGTSAPMEEMTPEGAVMGGQDTEGPMMDKPAYFGVSLTNASTGDVFKIQDFKDKVVLVETMAMWCTNCMRQQGEVVKLHEQLGKREDFVSVGLDVDPNERPEDLTKYVAKNGFDWYYAIAPAEVAREIAQLYGDQFLNPTATPMLIIDRQGEAHPLPFGIKSADELQKALEPYFES
jgi:thiol-disulfide isomerase/thioredoxin